MTRTVHSEIRREGTTAVVRVEDVYDTTAQDLWAAVTEPDRLARWIADVSGDLRVGGEIRLRFTSGWEGTARVVDCEASSRVRIASREDDGSESEVEARIVPEGARTRLIVEERGLPIDSSSAYRTGWQVHLEDLAAVLAGGERGDWAARWQQLHRKGRPQD